MFKNGCHCCVAALAGLAFAVASPATAQTYFTENWDDGLGSGRWTTPLFALENTDLEFDGAVDYAFDYSVLGAPSAPHSTGGTTTGVFMETNTTDAGSVNEGESVGILPIDFDLPSGDFRLTADVYLFWNGLSGSTEFATLGVHHQRSGNVPMRFNVNNGDGVAWQVDTDGDSGVSDIMQFAGLDGIGIETAISGYQDIPNGTVPNVPTGDVSPIGPFNQWIELSITQVGNLIEFAMNGYVLDTFDTEGFFTGGTILIGETDPFNSVNLDDGSGNSNGVVFDNIRVAAISDVLIGDYNGDGAVNAADYTVWRDTPLGTPVTTAGDGADGNFSGSIDAGDYTEWAANYGATSAALAVPEPSAALLLPLGLATFGAGRRVTRPRVR